VARGSRFFRGICRRSLIYATRKSEIPSTFTASTPRATLQKPRYLARPVIEASIHVYIPLGYA
jgi:hypothetical protein